MSGIYIPGERLPETLTAMWIFPNGDVAIFGRNEDITRIRKAIPVPEHGDLIARDALRTEVKKHATPSDAWVFSLIRTAPTVITADGEGIA